MMPGWEDGTGQNLSYASQRSQDYSSDYPAKILKSVKEQEAQFVKLTREFEADRLIAANQINRSRVDSDTASLHSIRRELDARNVDDPKMESLQYADPDPYASPYTAVNASQMSGHGPYAEIDYSARPYDTRDYVPHSDYSSPQHSNYQDYAPSDDGQPAGYGYEEPPLPPNDSHYSEAPPPSNGPYNGYNGSVSQPIDSYNDSDRRPSYHGSEPSRHESYRDDDSRHPSYREDDRRPSFHDDVDVAERHVGYPEDVSRAAQIEREDPYGRTERFEPPVEDSYREPSPIGPDPYGSISKVEDPYSTRSSRTLQPEEEDPYVSSRQPYDEYQAERGSRDPSLDDRSRASTLDRSRGIDHFIPPEKGDGEWAAPPQLREVIDYLSDQNQATVAHAAGYIQHLSYRNDDVKKQMRELGAIEPLVSLLGNPDSMIHRSACGSLRNLSYGKQHEENKVRIKTNGGIPALAMLVSASRDEETKELATGTLWNLSSSEPLKRTILEKALPVLVNSILIPESGWRPSGNSPYRPQDSPWSKTFTNATGCLRNISSAGHEARHRMRECEGLVDTLLHVIMSAIHNSDLDNKVVENTLCILRNLTFRIANEANHPDAIPVRQSANDKQNTQQKKGPESGSLICFGGSKKKDAQMSSSNGTAGKSGTWNPSQPIPDLKQTVRGAERLWQPSILNPYLAVLAECSKAPSLEAAAGTIQNITAGDWRWAMYIRAEMRKEKGLPILVELLRMKNDRVMIAVAKALRNLAIDSRNKDLIGKYGMQDLVERLPEARGGRTSKDVSNEGIVAVLQTMAELVTKNQENAKSLRSASGVERLVGLTKSKGAYPAAVIKAAYQVLHALWLYKDLRPQYKKDGWDEKYFHASSTFTTLPRSKTIADGSLPPTANDVDAGTKLPVRANTAPAPYSLDKPVLPPMAPTQPIRTAPPPMSNSVGYPGAPDEPPPPFEDPYHMSPARSQPPMYDERSVDRDFVADRLDQHSIPGEEISMQPIGNDYADNPYASTKRKAPPVGGVSVYGRLPEPQVDNYAHINRSTRSVSSEHYSERDYADYSHATPVHVQLQEDDQPAGDSWV